MIAITSTILLFLLLRAVWGGCGGGGNWVPERAMSGAQGIDPREKMRAGFAVVAVVLVAAVVVVTTPN